MTPRGCRRASLRRTFGGAELAEAVTLLLRRDRRSRTCRTDGRGIAGQRFLHWCCSTRDRQRLQEMIGVCEQLGMFQQEGQLGSELKPICSSRARLAWVRLHVHRTSRPGSGSLGRARALSTVGYASLVKLALVGRCWPHRVCLHCQCRWGERGSPYTHTEV